MKPQPVSLKARKVLEQCRGAVGDLTTGLQGDEWVRRWTVAITLLRAVGNVFFDEDLRRMDTQLKTEIQKEWEEKKKEPIFSGFIKRDRDDLLKHFKLHAGQSVVVQQGQPNAKYYYRIDDGPFVGKNPRAVAKVAIEWWDGYLTEIETSISH
jgi:hypothetical protein